MGFVIHSDYQKPETKATPVFCWLHLSYLVPSLPSFWAGMCPIRVMCHGQMGTLQSGWQVPGTEK